MADGPMDAGRTAGGIALTVRLTPKGGRDALDGIEMLEPTGGRY